MTITFDYEYDCGGYYTSRSIEIDEAEFEKDHLLVLVCAYIQGGYPGTDIDLYLHNKFPEVHTVDIMLQSGINVYDCNLSKPIKSFWELCAEFGETEEHINEQCREYNKEHHQENFSIWKD